MPIPLNRVVAFVGPYISLISGALAGWLVARANVLGISGLDEANLATQLSGALSFTLVAILTWLGQSKWLAGHRIAMANDACLARAAISTPDLAPALVRSGAALTVDADFDAVAFGSSTIVDESLSEDPVPGVVPSDAVLPDGTADRLRVVMPSEAPPEGEPDEDDEP